MENLSKLVLVKRHLNRIKSRTEKLSGFAGHLSGKYSLDSILEKENKSNPNPGKLRAAGSHS